MVCILEMAFAGNCGVQLDLTSRGETLMHSLFAEELGLILKVGSHNLDLVKQKLEEGDVSAEAIGKVTSSPVIELSVDGIRQLKEDTGYLRDLWEDTVSILSA